MAKLLKKERNKSSLKRLDHKSKHNKPVGRKVKRFKKQMKLGVSSSFVAFIVGILAIGSLVYFAHAEECGHDSMLHQVSSIENCMKSYNSSSKSYDRECDVTLSSDLTLDSNGGTSCLHYTNVTGFDTLKISVHHTLRRFDVRTVFYAHSEKYHSQTQCSWCSVSN